MFAVKISVTTILLHIQYSQLSCNHYIYRILGSYWFLGVLSNLFRVNFSLNRLTSWLLLVENQVMKNDWLGSLKRVIPCHYCISLACGNSANKLKIPYDLVKKGRNVVKTFDHWCCVFSRKQVHASRSQTNYGESLRLLVHCMRVLLGYRQ